MTEPEESERATALPVAWEDRRCFHCHHKNRQHCHHCDQVSSTNDIVELFHRQPCHLTIWLLLVELTLLILGRGALFTLSRSRYKYQWYCRALSSTSGPNADDTGAWKRAQPKNSIFYDFHRQNLFSNIISFLLHMWSRANPIQKEKPIIKSEQRDDLKFMLTKSHVFGSEIPEWRKMSNKPVSLAATHWEEGRPLRNLPARHFCRELLLAARHILDFFTCCGFSSNWILLYFPLFVRPCVRPSQAWHLTFLTYIKA